MITVQAFTALISQLLPEPHAGLLAGLLFGTKASLSKVLYDSLLRSGTLHIIALSGMNITIVADIFAKGLLRVVNRRIASMLTILGIIWFVWFVGSSPSIVRAAIMGNISLLAVVFGRQNWSLLTLVLAIGIMLLLNFSWLFDISFQLSALATLGIILFGSHASRDENFFAPLLARLSKKTGLTHVNGVIDSGGSEMELGKRAAKILSPLASIIEDDLRLTLAAQVFTIPLILFHFHRISLISPVSNILIGWLLAPLTILGWVTVVAGWIFLPFGIVVGWVDWVLLQYIIWIVTVTSHLPLASLGN